MIKQSHQIYYKEWDNTFDYVRVSLLLPEIAFGKIGISDERSFSFWEKKTTFALDINSSFCVRKEVDSFFFSFRILGIGVSIIRQWGY